MALINRIKTGDRVDINISGIGGETLKRVSSIVEAVLKNTEVLILTPMSGGAVLELPPGSKYEARFYTGSNVFLFDVSVSETLIIEGQYITILNLVSEGKRIQLRDFFRININLRFNFSRVEDHLNSDEYVLYEAITKDLSGGGISFLTDAELAEGTEIYANLVLDEEYIVGFGRVGGMQKAYSGKYKYLYRCQFLAMPDAQLEKIVRFVNKQQLKSVLYSSGYGI